MRISDWSSDVCSSDLALIAAPNAKALADARQAWLKARVPYQQTEALRFGNPIVDDWEGRVNAWPLDEGMIDYVDASYGTDSDANAYYVVNVIANKKLSVGGKAVDVSTITPELLREVRQERSEERRVGKEWVSTCRSRWWQ